MLVIAAAILIGSIIVNQGFRHMAKTIADATADLTTAVSAVVTDVAEALRELAGSISEHIANGTAVDAIEEQAARLNSLDEQIKAGIAPPAPTAPEPPAGSATDSDPAHVLTSDGAPAADAVPAEEPTV